VASTLGVGLAAAAGGASTVAWAAVGVVEEDELSDNTQPLTAASAATAIPMPIHKGAFECRANAGTSKSSEGSGGRDGRAAPGANSEVLAAGRVDGIRAGPSNGKAAGRRDARIGSPETGLTLQTEAPPPIASPGAGAGGRKAGARGAGAGSGAAPSRSGNEAGVGAAVASCKKGGDTSASVFS
jgi:hypothetical protein